MSDNTIRPDRANPGDFGDDLPTYTTGATGATGADTTSPFAGRAEPRSINPDPAAPTEQFSLGADSDFASSAQPAATLPAGDGAGAPVTMPPAPAVNTYPAATAAEVTTSRGTIDLGLFIIRVFTGLVLLLHSCTVFFAIGDSAGLTGLKNDYGSYAFPDVLAIAIPSAELVAGVFLILGLFTPVAAAIAVLATAFNALHEITQSGAGYDVFGWGEPVVLAVLLVFVAFGIQFTGPGFYSIDRSRSWADRPLASSLVFAVIGVAGAVALWWFGAGVNPFA